MRRRPLHETQPGAEEDFETVVPDRDDAVIVDEGIIEINIGGADAEGKAADRIPIDGEEIRILGRTT